MLDRKTALLDDKGLTLRISGMGRLFLLSLFFAKMKTRKEGDSFWQKGRLIFTNSIIKTIKKQRF